MFDLENEHGNGATVSQRLQSEAAAASLIGGLSGEAVIRAIEREGEVDLQQWTQEYTPSLTLAAREPEPEPDEEDGDDGDE